MNTTSLASLAVLFAACIATSAADAADAPKTDPGKTTAKPAPAPAPKPVEAPHASTPAPAPAPKTAEPPKAPTPAPAPAPKTAEPPHAPAPAPAPKPAEPPHAPAPAPVPAPKPAPAPAPVPPAPAPVSTAANTWDSWTSAKPVPTSFPAGVVFTKNTNDGATGNRVAYFVGRTDVTTTQGKLGEQHTASGAIRLSADLNTQTISGQMGGFTSGTAATATTLNGMGLTMAGSYDASGRITGTTAAQGQTLGKVTGTLTTTLAQGNWSLAKNDFAVNATFRAGRVNAPGH
jgi:YD repeat-containing protein